MSKLRVSVALLSASLLLLSACERPEPRDNDQQMERDAARDRGHRDRDDDRKETQTRTVAAFDGIELRGAAEMEINVGRESSVELQGSQGSIKRVDTHVNGSTLVIEIAKSHGWFTNYGHLKIVVNTPALKSLVSNGAGEMKIRGFDGGEHSLQLAGAHDVKAEGRLDKLTLEVSGAGKVDFNKVETQDARVVVNGAGDVELQAKNSLHAEVNGVGAIRYSGDPQKVESELHGLGTIARR